MGCGDKARLVEAFARLSPTSRHRRLLAPVHYDNRPMRALLRAFGPAAVQLEGNTCLFRVPIASRRPDARRIRPAGARPRAVATR